MSDGTGKDLSVSETGNITLLIVAYLTLNTSLNLLNKVTAFYSTFNVTS